jgi:hypothetical protein
MELPNKLLLGAINKTEYSNDLVQNFSRVCLDSRKHLEKRVNLHTTVYTV